MLRSDSLRKQKTRSVIFFFSSRRRHTRLQGDWSSDVCSSDLIRIPFHIEKGFVFAGMPARNGVTAALVVRSGWNGVDDVFSGEDNFFEAMAPKGDPAALAERLGERHEVTRTDIKKWTVGSPIQAPLDALDNLLRRRPFEADQGRAV